MTMVSFRADDADVAAADHWAQRLGVDRSELLRVALRRHLAELAADHDVAGYAEHPLTHDEASLANFADWGPDEKWSDFTDAKG
jgi:hypothetical protein